MIVGGSGRVDSERKQSVEPRDPLISPPYLTALPVVTTTKIEPEHGDFLITISYGLSDHLTNEQAVELVSRWLKTHDVTKEIVTPDLA